MKKLLAIILSIAILACCTIAASAEATKTANLKVSNAVVDENGDAIVEISLELGEGVNVAALELTVNYDSTKLTPVSQDPEDSDVSYCALVGTPNKKAMLEANASEAGTILLAAIQSTGATANGVYLTIKFEAALDADETTEVTVSSAKITTDTQEEVTVAVENGSVTAPNPDKTAADEAASLINALPAASAVTLDNEASIVAAKAAYDALTDAQKALVPSETVAALNAAVDALAALKASSSSSENSGTSSVTSSTSSTGNNTTTNPKTADNSVAFFAAILCAAMAAAFVVTKRVKD